MFRIRFLAYFAFFTMMLSSVSFASVLVRREAEKILEGLLVHKQSPVYAELVQVLENDPKFVQFVRDGNPKEAIEVARKNLLGEVAHVLKSQQLVPEKYGALYSFMEHEVPSALKLKKQYEKVLNSDLPSFIAALERGDFELLDPKAVANNIEKLPFIDQIKVFEAAAQNYPHYTAVNRVYEFWYYDFAFDPAKNPKKYLEFHQHFTANSPLAVLGEPVGLGTARLYDVRNKALNAPAHFEEKMANLKKNGFSKSVQWKEWFKGKKKAWIDATLQKPYYRRVDELISHIEKNYDHLPPRERLMVMYAKAEPLKQGGMYHYLYEPNDVYFTSDYIDEFMKGHEYSFHPEAKDELSRAFREMFEEGTFKRLSPKLFVKMIDENPKLAKRLLPTVMEQEVFPALLGDESRVKLPAFIPSDSKESLDRIVKYLKESDDEFLKERFRQLAYRANQGTRNVYHYQENFDRIIPMIDLYSIEGENFLAKNPPVHPYDQLYHKAEYRYAMKRYLSRSMAKDADEFLKEMMELQIFKAPGSLQKIYVNDGEGFKKLTKKFLSLSDELIRMKGLKYHQSIPLYQKVLTEYVEATADEKAIRGFRDRLKAMTEYRVPGEAHVVSHDPDMQKIVSDFDEWLLKNKKIVIESIPETAAKTLKGKPFKCDPAAFIYGVLKP